jgi:hypothetical protein
MVQVEASFLDFWAQKLAIGLLKKNVTFEEVTAPVILTD